MAILTNNLLAPNLSTTDGLHVIHTGIGNYSSQGTIIEHDNWNKITFLGCSAINANTSNPPSISTSDIGTTLVRSNLASDGSQTDTGMDNGHSSDSKSIFIHKTDGKWRLRHQSHGMNYDYIVLFLLASTQGLDMATHTLDTGQDLSLISGIAMPGETPIDLAGDERYDYFEALAEGQLKALRIKRDSLLSETDWWAVADRTMTQEQTDYRQALRDITDTYSSNEDVVWPDKPEI